MCAVRARCWWRPWTALAAGRWVRHRRSASRVRVLVMLRPFPVACPKLPVSDARRGSSGVPYRGCVVGRVAGCGGPFGAPGRWPLWCAENAGVPGAVVCRRQWCAEDGGPLACRGGCPSNVPGRLRGRRAGAAAWPTCRGWLGAPTDAAGSWCVATAVHSGVGRAGGATARAGGAGGRTARPGGAAWRRRERGGVAVHGGRRLWRGMELPPAGWGERYCVGGWNGWSRDE